MQITKNTLYAIADICNYSSSCMDDLRELLPLLNIDNKEKESIEDAIITLDNKIYDIRNSQISELPQHIEEIIKNVENNSRY